MPFYTRYQKGKQFAVIMDIMEGFSGFLHHWEGIEAQLEQATADKARACAMQGLKLTREESLRRKSTCPAFISL